MVPSCYEGLEHLPCGSLYHHLEPVENMRHARPPPPTTTMVPLGTFIFLAARLASPHTISVFCQCINSTLAFRDPGLHLVWSGHALWSRWFKHPRFLFVSMLGMDNRGIASPLQSMW